MESQTPNYSGSVLAIAGLIVAGIAMFFHNVNIQASDVAQIITGFITLVGIIKQMIDHNKVVTVANTAIAGERKS